MKRAAVAIAALAVVAAVVAVVAASRDERRAAGLPRCARSAATIPRPLQLPAHLRFPRGTIFTSVRQNVASHGVPLIRGLMPLDLDGAARFLDDELPRTGVKVTIRRNDPGRREEAHYSVPRYGGFVEIDALRGCPGATAFSVSARRTLYGRARHSE